MKWLSSGVLSAKNKQLQYSAAIKVSNLTALQHYMCSSYLALQLAQAVLQGIAAINKRLSNRNVLTGKGRSNKTDGQ